MNIMYKFLKIEMWKLWQQSAVFGEWSWREQQVFNNSWTNNQMTCTSDCSFHPGNADSLFQILLLFHTIACANMFYDLFFIFLQHFDYASVFYFGVYQE